MPKNSNTPPDSPIQIGRPHRARCDIEMRVYDYDALATKIKILKAGEIFKPWEPLDHWRGFEVPITLDDAAQAFDWGVSSFEGYFLAWDDFFLKCEVLE